MRGSDLRELREQRGIKAAWVAERIGLRHRQQINKIENKKDISVDEFIAYVGALGLKPGDLLDNSAGLVTPEIRPILDLLVKLQPTVRTRTLRVVEQIVGMQDELEAQQPAPREDNVLDFVPAKSPTIPTSDKQIDSLQKAMGSLGAEPRRARHGEDYSVPLVANLSAGRGLETFTREHEFRDINAYYWNRGVRAVFRVVGSSMFDMGITDRDLVYVRPIEYSAPKNGDVVACTVNNESYVKVYEKDDQGIVWLKSKSEGYAPIEVKPDDELRIWGVVLGRTGDL